MERQGDPLGEAHGRTEVVPERRHVAHDRRRSPTPMLSRHTFFGGRRKAGRRPDEASDIYVDRYDRRITAVFVLILALNVLDAYFTLVFIQHGGTEANPIAQWFLDLGALPFILAKSAAIGFFLLVLVLHKTFLSVPRLLTIVLIFYTGLLVYHLALQLTVVPRL